MSGIRFEGISTGVADVAEDYETGATGRQGFIIGYRVARARGHHRPRPLLPCAGRARRRPRGLFRSPSGPLFWWIDALFMDG